MDPITIVSVVSTALGASVKLGQLSYDLFQFIHNVKTIDQSVRDFQIQTSNMCDICKTVEKQFQIIPRPELIDQQLLDNINKQLRDCTSATNTIKLALRSVLKGKQGSVAHAIRRMLFLMSMNEFKTSREHLKICMTGLQVNLQVLNLQAIYLAPQIANESLVAAVRQLTELVEAQGEKLDEALKQKAVGYVSQAMSLYSASLDGSHDHPLSALAVEEWLVKIRDHSTTEPTNEAVSVLGSRHISVLENPFDSSEGQSSIEVASNLTSQRSNPFDSASQESSRAETASMSTTTGLSENPSEVLINSNYLVSKVVWSLDNSTMAIAGERLFPEQKIEHGFFYDLPFTRKVSLDCACIGVYKTGSADLLRQLDAPCRTVQNLALNHTGTLVVYGWILLSFRACFEVRDIETGDLVRRKELFEGNPSQGLNIDLAFANVEPYLIAVLNSSKALPKSVVVNIKTSKTMKRYAWEEAEWALILGSAVCVRSGSKLIQYDPMTGGILSQLSDERIQKLEPLRHHLALSGESLAIFYAAKEIIVVYDLRKLLQMDTIRVGNASDRSSLTYNGSRMLTTLMNHGQEWRLRNYGKNILTERIVAGSFVQSLSHDGAYIYHLAQDRKHSHTQIRICDTKTLLQQDFLSRACLTMSRTSIIWRKIKNIATLRFGYAI